MPVTNRTPYYFFFLTSGLLVPGWGMTRCTICCLWFAGICTRHDKGAPANSPQAWDPPSPQEHAQSFNLFLNSIWAFVFHTVPRPIPDFLNPIRAWETRPTGNPSNGQFEWFWTLFVLSRPPGARGEQMCLQSADLKKKHVFWAPKTNVRKLTGLSNNLYKSFVHQKQMSGLSKKNMSLGHQKQMSGNPLGSQKAWVLGFQNKCQENFWALQNYVSWAFKKFAELSKNMSFGHLSKSRVFQPKKISGNPPGSLRKYMNFGHQNKCQETFWALKKTWVLDTNNKCQETRCDQKHVFWAPKTNVRKLAGLSNNLYKSCVDQKQMSGLSKKTWVLGTKNKRQETHWALNKASNLGTKTNVRIPSGPSRIMCFGHSGNSLSSNKNMSFGHLSKSMSFGTKNKYQETRRAL